MTYSPLVSVIIPTYKDWNRLQRCLDALAGQTYPQENFEVIVVNNDSEHADKSVLDFDVLAANVILINEPIPGSYSARNKGLQVARGEVIGFTDSDRIPDADWIANAVKVYEANSNAQRVAGTVKVYREQHGGWLAWKFESVTAFNQKHNVRNGVSVTANLFVKKALFDQVGLFNTSIFSGGDIEWNQRATKLGVNIFLADSVIVQHPARLSMRDLINKGRRVLGGGFVRAKQERRLVLYTLRHCVPPVKYAMVLYKDGKSLFDVVFASVIYWVIKLLMVVEIFRLSLGARPVR